MKIMSTLKRLVAGPEPQSIPDLGRNDRCWCGSGQKYKSCHLDSDSRKRAAMRSATGAQQQSLTRGF